MIQSPPVAARAIREIKLAVAALRGQVPAIRWSVRRTRLREGLHQPAVSAAFWKRMASPAAAFRLGRTRRMITEKDFQTSARALSYALAGRGLAPDRCLRIMRIFAATIDLNPEDKAEFLVLAMPVPEQGKPPAWMRNLVYGTAVWVDHTIEVLQRLEKSGSRRGTSETGNARRFGGARSPA